MPKFDQKYWNDAVFQKYLSKIPNLKENSMVKNGVLQVNNSLKARLVDGVGGNTLIEPIKGLVDGDFVNYDGNTNITTSSRNTFMQKKIVCGRAKGWEEKDFSTDISGEDYMPVASEVAEYWQGVDMGDILSILKGIFAMSDTAGADFVSKHTYELNTVIDETAVNNASQKAFGDKKNKNVAMVFMHSKVATTLENLNLIGYLKYTDKDGIQSNLPIGQLGSKIVIVDDDMPILEGYDTATSTDAGALKVVASGATAGQINLADVKKTDFYPAGVAANDYVVAGTKYVSYLLGKGAIEFCNVGAKVPSEVARDAATDGGVDKLYTRQRKLYAPKYISWAGAANIISPMPEQLATGSNWEIVNDGESSKTYVDARLIPFGRIITRG